MPYLDVSFVHLAEKAFDSVLIFVVMNHEKTNLRSSDKSTDEPLIEFVNSFQMHVTSFPFMFVDEIESRVSNELIQMGMILFLSEFDHVV